MFESAAINPATTTDFGAMMTMCSIIGLTLSECTPLIELMMEVIFPLMEEFVPFLMTSLEHMIDFLTPFVYILGDIIMVILYYTLFSFACQILVLTYIALKIIRLIRFVLSFIPCKRYILLAYFTWCIYDMCC